MKNTYNLETKLNDNIMRVVWLIGRINTTHDNTRPLVDVWFVELDKYDKPIKNKGILLTIQISDLDYIKVGTIWNGSKKTSRFFKFKDECSCSFSFSFSDNHISQIRNLRRSEKIEINGKNQNINVGEFNLWHYLPQCQQERLSVTSHSQLTVLKSSTLADVLIPSLELFTSTYAPKNKNIRNDLLTIPLVDVVNKYVVNKSVLGREGRIFYLEPRIVTSNEDLTFLAHIALNIETKKRLSHIYSAVKNEKGLYIHPYHIKEMEMECEGMWLDTNKTTFLVLRITAYSLPNEYEIKTPRRKTKTQVININPSIKRESKANDQNIIVKIIGNKPIYTHLTEISKNEGSIENPPFIINGVRYSTVPKEIHHHKMKNPIIINGESEYKILPSQFLISINNAITKSTNGRKHPFCNVEYYDQHGNISNNLKYGNMAGKIFLLVKISQIYCNHPIKKRTAYLLEFDRSKGVRGCQALVFNTHNGCLNLSLLVDILNKIKDNQYQYKRKNIQTQKKEVLVLPVDKISFFKHALSLDKFNENYMARLLSKLEQQWRTEING